MAADAADPSSAWHFLTEQKIPRCSNGLAAGDEIGLDAAYLVSVVVEQALTVHEAAAASKRVADGGGGGGARSRCPAGRRHRRQHRRGRETSAVPAGPEPEAEAVRRLLCDVYADATAADIADDADLVRFVLGRLHAAAAAAGTGAAPSWFRLSRWCPSLGRRRGRRAGLGPPLSLFLRRLHDVSHTTCWHLDEWRRRRDRDELRALGAFAKLLCRDAVRPADALLDAIEKGNGGNAIRNAFRLDVFPAFTFGAHDETNALPTFNECRR